MKAVSAVIPAYNGAAFIAEAITSVLAQTHPVVECLVIDDGSTDPTAEVVAGFGEAVTYIRLPNGGVCRARNRGAELAQGELIAFLDHDDLWMPMKLERQVETLLAQPDAPMVLCAQQTIDASGAAIGVKRIRRRSAQEVVTAMLTFDQNDAVALPSNAVIRRDWLRRGGGFDPALSTSADWDLQLRAALDGGFAYVDEPLMRYRVHGTNMSRNVALMERDMRHVFAKVFSDPRLPSGARSLRRRAYARLYRMLAGSYRDIGDRTAMARTLMTACCYDPAVALELPALLRRAAQLR